jgi:hypothetical protein
VWDGAKWTVTGGGAVRYFYMPSVNIPVNTTGTKTFELYEAYRNQFVKSNNQAGGSNPWSGPNAWVSNNTSLAQIPSPETDRLYNANELDYVITYYDKSIISALSINASGVMSYTVSSIATTAATYFNIILVVK